ncbi:MULTISPECIES: MBL fold metallo-hydrolase [unclassified Motilimonas]|uniref:MBL fold metallo-hydrolase n=1 Tax=unclassified Motilimonas TaxID=2643697 RepID=UPI001E53D438|nr:MULTISPECIES: MBL fold metallo-hydrolase [unclassified Motilimonas]MCE0559128.1 MBL fold metallo-hydrolase [Motilimonas sp. E26]MDO6525353.1 MBL fold metallo-hydrolase [Motilimonas sp. 1_MG-2023]
MKKLVLLTAAALLSHSVFAEVAKPLTLKVYNADESSFNVNSTLVYGENEALVVDTGFSKADALRIAANVLDSGKTLTTIFISQADPDYYFGAEVLHKMFPDAAIITTPAVRTVIEKKLKGKIAFWAPQMGANAPEKPIIPTAYSASTISIDGVEIEIKGTQGQLAHRPYLWIPANKAILGNVAVSGNLHLWMADTQSDEELQAWSAQLKEMKSLKPEVVIPGHMTPDSALDLSSVQFSLSYLTTFISEKSKANNSAELINAMDQAYPQAASPSSLELSAKVHTGEMTW